MRALACDVWLRRVRYVMYVYGFFLLSILIDLCELVLMMMMLLCEAEGVEDGW
jgi:hypothetical protein